tara:strand:+ start:1237 stop:1464 length:228 start_codon:yes stop_codon:yes gene_type:complete
VSVVLVVTLVLSITSENVTATVEFIDTEDAESAGDNAAVDPVIIMPVDDTLGEVVSSLKEYDSKAGMVAEMPRLL